MLKQIAMANGTLLTLLTKMAFSDCAPSRARKEVILYLYHSLYKNYIYKKIILARSRFFVCSGFSENFTFTRQKPKRTDSVKAYERNNPTDIEITSAVVFLLRVEVPLVNAVCIEIAGDTSRHFVL